jgi:hypothetical protein
MAEHDWSRDEVEAIVADYFGMLGHELTGARVNKSEHNERLRAVLQRRSKGSVEFKHANISAVLTEHGYPYTTGTSRDRTSKRCSNRSSWSIWTCIEIFLIH